MLHHLSGLLLRALNAQVAGTKAVQVHHEVARMWVISTAHLDIESFAILNETSKDWDPHWILCWPKEDYGFFISINPDLEPGQMEISQDDISANRNRARAVLRNIIHTAEAYGYQWVMFDRDADVVPELPTFEN